MAFKRWQRAPSKKGLKKTWSESEMKIIAWCLNNDIKVGMNPDWKHGLNHWQIDININGKNHSDPKRYDNDQVLSKMYEYYKYYYDKHNVNTNKNG